MKCPHCGIYYMDDERVCPICGKRPGIAPPKRKSVPYPNMDTASADTDRRPKPKEKPADRAAGAWQRAAEQAKEHDHLPYYTSRPKAKKTHAFRPVFLIIMILVVVSICTSLIRNVADELTDISTPTWESPADDDTDSIYAEADILDALPAGTWQEDGSDRTITIYEDGSIDWSVGGVTADADYISVDHLLLDEDNASTYCTEDELERYPVAAYSQYTLYLSDWDGNLDTLYLCLYLPNGESVDDRGGFDCYDYETSGYSSFSRVGASAPETPDAASPADAPIAPDVVEQTT